MLDLVSLGIHFTLGQKGNSTNWSIQMGLRM